jgi:2-amino-4-hydroxy-6-hydroxymethyldihydropteridine diphosphokinase
MITASDSPLFPVFLLLGSNVGDRTGYLRFAHGELQKNEVEIQTQSCIYESEAWGFNCKDLFLNQVILVESLLNPHELLQLIQKIESEAGRIRSDKQYTSRTLDIDILFYGDQIVKTDDLIIPHPRLHLRLFSLVPLAEIAPDLKHPVFKKNIKTLLAECPDLLQVYPINDPV